MATDPVVPAALRARLVALTAEALPRLEPVPPALRRVAAFAPARRAKAGGPAIWSALADDEFRARVATQVVAALPESRPPLDEAAVAWLGRPEGWAAEVEDRVRAVLEHERAATSTAETAALREEIEALKAQVREARAQARADEKALKAEIADLRRRLGDARRGEREAVAARDEAVAAAGARADEAARAVDRAETEARRARDQAEAARAEAHSERREHREERGAGQTRAWYLLDALVESAVGLRRELGLPAASATPGEAVEAAYADDARVRDGRPVTPQVLDQLLTLPRARLLVDGYNVTKLAWPTATLEAQRSRLLAALAPLVARTGAETTVVFDAAAAGARAALPAPRGVRVVFSPPGVIADDVLRQLVAAEPGGRTVVAVTSDRALAADLAREGARVVGSDVLVSAVTPG